MIVPIMLDIPPVVTYTARNRHDHAAQAKEA